MNIDDLEKKSISEMTTEELIEFQKQIRLNRRTAMTRKREAATKQTKSKKSVIPNLTPEQAQALLDKLTGASNES